MWNVGESKSAPSLPLSPSLPHSVTLSCGHRQAALSAHLRLRLLRSLFSTLACPPHCGMPSPPHASRVHLFLDLGGGASPWNTNAPKGAKSSFFARNVKKNDDDNSK